MNTTLVRANETQAENDINQTPMDTPVSGAVLTNDRDAQGDDQFVTSALADTDGDGLADDSLPTGSATPVFGADNTGAVVPAGALTLHADGMYGYMPAPGFTGTVPAAYSISDDNAQPATDSATLTIEVVEDVPGTNDPPVAQDDTGSTELGVPVGGDLLANDGDPDGNPVAVTDLLADTDGDGLADDPAVLSTPTAVSGTDRGGSVVPAGALTVNPDGTYTFTPNATFIGTVPAVYTSEDPGGLGDLATLTITVEQNPGNVTCANDDASIGVQALPQAGNILANDSDPEGDTQSITLIDTDGDKMPDTAPVAGVPVGIMQGGTPIGILTIDPATGECLWAPEPDYIGTAVVSYKVSDNGAPTASDTATLYLTTLVQVNEAPTDIYLSNATVPENQPSGTAVGTLSTTDPDTGNTFVYALTNGTGSTDNGSFMIEGSNLLAAVSFNYEIKNSYSIRVQSTDQGGLFTQKVFNVTVINAEEPPPVMLRPDIASDGTVVIRWTSVANHFYTVHHTTNLLIGFSVLQTDVPATPAVNSYTDTVNGVKQKFWQVSTEP